MQREDGFRRISAVTTWVAAGSLAALGALAALVGHEIPGRTHTGASGSGSSQHATGGNATPAGQTHRSVSRSSDDGGLNAPSRAPSSGFGAGSTTSGAS